MGAPILDRLMTGLEERGFQDVYDNLVKNASSVIEDRIPVWGRTLVNALRNFKERSNLDLGDYLAQREPLINKIKQYPDVVSNYYDYFVGRKIHPDPAVKQLVDFDKGWNLKAYSDAVKRGIKVGPPNSDNYSRIWPRDYGRSEEKVREMVEYLVKSGQAADENEARRVVDIAFHRSRGMKSYNLRVGRKYDLPGWRKDVYSQSDAMRGKVHDMNFTQLFGDSGEELSKLLSQIYKDHGERAHKLAQRYTDIVLRRPGYYYKPFTPVERSLNSVLAARYLGGVGIRHLFQSFNTVVFGGRMKPFIYALADTASKFPDARSFGLRLGALVDDTLRDASRLVGEELPETKLGKASFKLTGFPSILHFNRVLSANYGKYLAEELLEDYKLRPTEQNARKLYQLGIDAERAAREGLSKLDISRAMQRTVNVTMEPSDPAKLPLAWRASPIGRVLTQYKNFIYSQSLLLKDYMLKPAVEYFASGGSRGDLRPLLYFSMVFPIGGEVVGDAYNLFRHETLKYRPKQFLDRYLDDISWMGGLGMLSDLVYELSSGELFSGTPLSGELRDILKIPFSKHPAKQAAKQIPLIGPSVSEQMRPKAYRPQGLEGFFYKGGATKIAKKLLGGQ